MNSESVNFNRRVYALLRIAGNVPEAFVENSFDRVGWECEKRGKETYVVSIPLYSARIAALEKARALIHDFSKKYVPVVAEELRLLAPPEDRRHSASVSRTGGSLRSALLYGRGKLKGIPVDPLHWNVAIPRSQRTDLEARQEEDILAAERLLMKSPLPGAPFSPEIMEITTRAEPKTVNENVWAEPYKAIGLSAAFGIAILLHMAVATATFIEIGMGWRILTGTLAVASSVIIALWFTGNRPLKRQRALGIIIAIAVSGVFGFTFAQTIQDEGFPDFTQSMRIVGVIIGLVIVVPGLIHLLVLHPRMRVLWSVPFLSLFAAAATAGSQALVEMGAQLVGIPADMVAVPIVFRFGMAATIALILGVAGLIVLSAIGWFKYFSLPVQGTVVRVCSYIVVSSLLFFAVVGAIIMASNVLSSTIEGWRETINGGETPPLTSGFIYRACVDGGLDSPDSTRQNQPIVVIEGRGGSHWEWDTNATSAPFAKRLEANLDVTPVADGVSQCVNELR